MPPVTASDTQLPVTEPTAADDLVRVVTSMAEPFPEPARRAYLQGLRDAPRILAVSLARTVTTLTEVEAGAIAVAAEIAQKDLDEAVTRVAAQFT